MALAAMKIFPRDTCTPFFSTIRILRQCVQETGISLGVSCWEKEMAKGSCQPGTCHLGKDFTYF